MNFAPLATRPVIQSLVGSKIREVANAGLGSKDILGFWVGEPDLVTPDFIRAAGAAAIEAGETFYTNNFGIPELRETLAAYLSRLHRPTPPETIAVTNSGMSALMLVTQALVGPGDRVVTVVPLWPNIPEIPKVVGASVTRVALDFTPAGWRLDLDRLLAALTPGTRAVYINSPNNPTGWTLDRASQEIILAHCRRHGIWIVADDAYERLHFAAPGPAPSFLDIADARDRVVSTNTFSKTWLMTGWRLGWLVAPAEVMPDIGKLIEYNTCCSPVFVQRAGVVAVRDGEPTVASSLARFVRSRDVLLRALNQVPGIVAPVPPGAMYAFFRIEGMTDSLDFCKRIVAAKKLGLAPGAAFGDEGEGFIRWCFASTEERLLEGVARLADFLATERR
jgi:aspartate/methionine/tyrosine aminotransferase